MSCWSARWASRCSAPRRDFAVALVDVTQHFARLSEALVTLLSPHELTGSPASGPARAEGWGEHRLRADQLRLSRESACLRPVQSCRRTRWEEGRPDRTVRRRQVHPHRPSAEILRFTERPDLDRWTRHFASYAGEPQRRDRRRAARRAATQPFADGEHPLRTSRSDRRRSLERVRRSPMRRIHWRPPGRPRYDCRRPRRSVVRRSASAPRDRTSVVKELAHPSARRSYLSSRHRSRGGDPRRVFGPHAGTNRHRRCASVVDAAGF